MASRARRNARIRGVAESAQLHDYVLGLPHQYGTVVGERGVSLSGGQRQRLSIARTLMKNPAVLIFDDSTAAIDAGTESRIRAAMKDYASRPRDADRGAPPGQPDACRPDPVPGRRPHRRAGHP